MFGNQYRNYSAVNKAEVVQANRWHVPSKISHHKTGCREELNAETNINF